MAEKKDKLTEKIIEEIENGAAARWFNPYKAPPIQNLKTGWRYQHYNAVMLECCTLRNDGYCPYFVTFNQAQEWGGLRKGSKAAAFVQLCLSQRKDDIQMAIDAAELTDLDDEELSAELSAASFKRAAYAVQRVKKVVFSGLDLVSPPEQVIRLAAALKGQTPEVLKGAIPDLYGILQRAGVPVKVGGGQAYYSPADDVIVLPPPAAMRGGVAVYCATALHELTHAYCARGGRGNRSGYWEIGRQLEEMTAELGSLLLCNALQLPYSPTNRPSSLRYIQDWGGKCWRELLPAAIQEAQKRADYILSVVDGDNN